MELNSPFFLLLLFCAHVMHEIGDLDNEFFLGRSPKDSSLLEGTEYRVVDTEDGQVASVTLTLDPDEEVRTVAEKLQT